MNDEDDEPIIKVEQRFEEEPTTETRPEQKVLCLALMNKTVFLEWGAAIGAVATQVRHGLLDMFKLEFLLRSGQTIELGPCTDVEMATAVNHVFGKTASVEAPEEVASEAS